ncbi:hypothetical protein PF005_g26464 [Phytophthora fragariae]|uniref:BZIP domain-containing protein n=1 Tax=Phytophthora fragariae TaxID=53985 RepID=A0A6A3Z4Z1_9STRA|nr:hypothetical protein PF003_g11964 [Phytophthora fragariae]KAE8936253.1 hypothetical protein PF009_g13826 [Phytophthora fragariae]KAE9009337.1 hypothetical protein PF011_g10318 [Phytophthora fragariae]KAE9085807.1 hypothetical protein PF006_g26167 [Phytophthora fragariae]KAE9108899.1 hypothetical protein PF010_g11738 [Phytophthora fragariae]
MSLGAPTPVLFDPLRGADPELQAMASYFLAPDAAPEEDTENSSPNRMAAATSTSTTADKKLKRNERDRQRSFAKRESMKQMRQQVKTLENRKQQLVQRAGDTNSPNATPDSPQNQEVRSPSSISAYPSPSTPIKRENFVRLANEIEDFRRQNAAMTQQLRERDVSTGYMQNLLLEFSQDETDSDTNSSDGSSNQTKPKDRKPKSSEPLGSGPRPFNGDSSVRFTPLTREEGLACVRQTLQLINNARFLYASDAHYHNRSKFLGWGQYTVREGSTITFSVKKSLPNVTPKQLMDTTWHLLTDGKNTQKLIPSTVNTHIRPLQKLSDDLFVIDRRSEDNARSGVFGNKLALRTVYVLFRVADADGSQTLAMKTINLPLVKKLLRHDEQWCDIFYWIRFLPDGSVRSSGGGANGRPRDFETVTEFGGSNTYTRDEIAKAWLGELVFLAIRWESLAVAPTLLKF